MTEKQRPVVVTTAHRGVFFGYLASQDGTTVHLTKARNCVYWSAKLRGFVGLAATGPDSDCRIGPAADMELSDVTAVLDCSPEAVEKWEAQPWGS